jgi:hypothetical protein|tara:strand:- start:824 stop:1372 length:549 start_codon:yes stop_codon:yes gene_type:complete
MNHLLSKSYSINVGSASQYILNINFKFDVLLIRGKFNDSSIFVGDRFSVDIAPDTHIGASTINSISGSSILYIDESTIKNIEVGKKLKLTDGINTSDLGVCFSVGDNFITFENATTHDFDSGSSVLITTPVVESFIFTDSGLQTLEGLADKKLLPKNTDIKITYNNPTGTSKVFVFDLQVFY